MYDTSNFVSCFVPHAEVVKKIYKPKKKDGMKTGWRRLPFRGGLYGGECLWVNRDNIYLNIQKIIRNEQNYFVIARERYRIDLTECVFVEDLMPGQP